MCRERDTARVAVVTDTGRARAQTACMLSTTALRRSVTAAAALAALAVPAAAQASGTVTEFPTPTADAAPLGITSGPDGAVWFTEHSGAAPKPIGRIDPSGAITEFETEPGSVPDSITTGADGNLWFTDPGKNQVGRITPAGVYKGFGGLGLISTHGIASGPDKHLYVVDAGGNQIVELTPSADGTTVTGTPIAIPTPGSNAQQITAGPDGNMWFTEANTSKVGRVNLGASPKTITEFDLSPNTGPRGIAVGPDKKLWVAEADAKKIGRLSPDGTGYQETTTTATGTSDPEGLVAGRDGAMWVSIFNGRSIGRVTQGLALTQFSVAQPADMGPRFIAAGADGNVWFTDESHSAIGRVTVDKPKPADTTRPVLSKLRVTRGKVRFTASETATVRLTFARRTTGRHPHYVAKGTLTVTAVKGARTVPVPPAIGTRKLSPGRYRVTATAKDAAGNRTKRAVRATFTLRRAG